MIKGFVKGALETLGYTVKGIRHQPRQLLDRANLRTLEFDDVVCRRMFEVGPTLTFVQIGAFAFWEMVLFIALLAIGLGYAWKKGVLEWK